MRKTFAAAVAACTVALVAPAGVAETVDPGFSRVCVIEYNVDQIPALAAGLHADDILYHSGDRADAVALWKKEQDTLRAGLEDNGWGTLKDIDKDSLWPVEDHTASSVIAEDLGSSDTGAPTTLDTPFSAGEVAYFKSAASYTTQRFQDCGREVNRPVPAAPSSLDLALAPGKIAGIVVALLAVLGAGAAFAASAGLIPGVALPF
ncbi:hypothetical protein [Corynebacterium fournieri]|uniref:hypothetical protein n=1 Tax=Corynebacterium fournieri TaxID=1852390 RepID=UPI000A2F097B|nr:hypothetical protein [Corynebacterium fournieri]WJY98009.1 hypothetical protein CFOUR_08020 [Corynebacterium fournieri]